MCRGEWTRVIFTHEHPGRAETRVVRLAAAAGEPAAAAGLMELTPWHPVPVFSSECGPTYCAAARLVPARALRAGDVVYRAAGLGLFSDAAQVLSSRSSESLPVLNRHYSRSPTTPVPPFRCQCSTHSRPPLLVCTRPSESSPLLTPTRAHTPTHSTRMHTHRRARTHTNVHTRARTHTHTPPTHAHVHGTRRWQRYSMAGLRSNTCLPTVGGWWSGGSLAPHKAPSWYCPPQNRAPNSSPAPHLPWPNRSLAAAGSGQRTSFCWASLLTVPGCRGNLGMEGRRARGLGLPRMRPHTTVDWTSGWRVWSAWSGGVSAGRVGVSAGRVGGRAFVRCGGSAWRVGVGPGCGGWAPVQGGGWASVGRSAPTLPPRRPRAAPP